MCVCFVSCKQRDTRRACVAPIYSFSLWKEAGSDSKIERSFSKNQRFCIDSHAESERPLCVSVFSIDKRNPMHGMCMNSKECDVKNSKKNVKKWTTSETIAPSIDHRDWLVVKSIWMTSLSKRIYMRNRFSSSSPFTDDGQREESGGKRSVSRKTREKSEREWELAGKIPDSTTLCDLSYVCTCLYWTRKREERRRRRRKKDKRKKVAPGLLHVVALCAPPSFFLFTYNCTTPSPSANFCQQITSAIFTSIFASYLKVKRHRSIGLSRPNFRRRKRHKQKKPLICHKNPGLTSNSLSIRMSIGLKESRRKKRPKYSSQIFFNDCRIKVQFSSNLTFTDWHEARTFNSCQLWWISWNWESDS